MKSFALLLFNLLITVCVITAKPVRPEMAKTIGENFIRNNGSFKALSKTASFDLVYTSTASISGFLSPINCYFVFNINQDGFVIVAADDKATPILAYSNEGVFDATNIPSNVHYWLGEYTSQIQKAITSDTYPTSDITDNWNSLANNHLSKTYAKKAVVGPLIQTKWDQDNYYNNKCPYDSTAKTHVVTGCVATATAQIMKYWNYPIKGKGHHKYKHQVYGNLSVNYDSATYNWSLMPNIASAENFEEVSTLIYHVGVSMEMQYTVSSSGAMHVSLGDKTMPCAENALKYYFGYNQNLKSVVRDNYTPADWYYLLKAELDAGRPILYSGYGSAGDPGHCFINDGYDNFLIHMNWGWGGHYNGFFTMQALTPSGVGIGGGGGDFNAFQTATIGILPAPQQPPVENYFNLKLVGNISLDPVSPKYGERFSVMAVVKNLSPNTFTGSIRIGLYDQNNTLLQVSPFSRYDNYITDTKSISANTTNIYYIRPYWETYLSQGTYTLRIIYSNYGEDWHMIEGATDSILDSALLTIELPDPIALDAPFMQSAELKYKQPVTLDLNLINKDSSPFYGEYAINFYSPYSNYKIGSLGTYMDTVGLFFNTPKPALSFTTNSLNVVPGVYILKAEYRSFSDNIWRTLGATNYQNPLLITITHPRLEADAFENNNAVQNAYVIPLDSLPSGTVSISANCHEQSDIDYYTLSLKKGSRYSFSMEIFDVLSNPNSSIYSLDAQFSYSLDGVNWSNPFDNMMMDNLNLNGGGNLYLKVSPFFAGDTGTYLFNILVQQSVATHISDLSQTVVSNIYPNPANNYIQVEASESFDKIELTNLQGKIVVSINLFEGNTKKYRLPTHQISSGLYFLNISTNRGLIREKILIEH